MKNLSGNGNWSFDGESHSDGKAELHDSRTEVQKQAPIDVKQEIFDAKALLNTLVIIYAGKPNKHLHDALISFSAGLKSLQKV